jgi:hypothetical protein
MELTNIVPWGRSFQEYKEMFSLSARDLEKSILGCGDGPASFNAELSSQGGNVISVDPIYCFTAKQLKSRILEVFKEVMQQMQLNKDRYVWDNIDSIEELGKIRMSAMEKFVEDYVLGKKQGRYIEGSLPQLGFNDYQFELALCSHYLFLYSEQISVQAHIDSLQELCRVAKEVRVYPLLALDGGPSPHLSQVILALNRLNLSATLVDVSYEFQKGATQMLVLKSP